MGKSMDEILEGFSEVAKEHALEPYNYGKLHRFNAHAKVTGPCGDTMEFWLYFSNGIAEEVAFTTDGCATSLACGSMTTHLAQSVSFEDIFKIKQNNILEALKGLPEESSHCALLASNTLIKAAQKYIIQAEKEQK